MSPPATRTIGWRSGLEPGEQADERSAERSGSATRRTGAPRGDRRSSPGARTTTTSVGDLGDAGDAASRSVTAADLRGELVRAEPARSAPGQDDPGDRHRSPPEPRCGRRRRPAPRRGSGAPGPGTCAGRRPPQDRPPVEVLEDREHVPAARAGRVAEGGRRERRRARPASSARAGEIAPGRRAPRRGRPRAGRSGWLASSARMPVGRAAGRAGRGGEGGGAADARAASRRSIAASSAATARRRPWPAAGRGRRPRTSEPAATSASTARIARGPGAVVAGRRDRASRRRRAASASRRAAGQPASPGDAGLGAHVTAATIAASVAAATSSREPTSDRSADAPWRSSRAARRQAGRRGAGRRERRRAARGSSGDGTRPRGGVGSSTRPPPGVAPGDGRRRAKRVAGASRDRAGEPEDRDVGAVWRGRSPRDRPAPTTPVDVGGPGVDGRRRSGRRAPREQARLPDRAGAGRSATRIRSVATTAGSVARTTPRAQPGAASRPATLSADPPRPAALDRAAVDLDLADPHSAARPARRAGRRRRPRSAAAQRSGDDRPAAPDREDAIDREPRRPPRGPAPGRRRRSDAQPRRGRPAARSIPSPVGARRRRAPATPGASSREQRPDLAPRPRRPASASTRSALVTTASPSAIPSASSSSRCSMVWARGPSSAATTSSAASISPAPTSMLPTSRSWPGTSTKSSSVPSGERQVRVPDVDRHPARRSSGSRSASMPVRARSRVVLPWSMWPAVPTTTVTRRRAPAARRSRARRRPRRRRGSTVRRSKHDRVVHDPGEDRPASRPQRARGPASATRPATATPADGSVSPGSEPPPTVDSSSTTRAPSGPPSAGDRGAPALAARDVAPRSSARPGSRVAARPGPVEREGRGDAGEDRLVRPDRARERVAPEPRDEVGPADDQPRLRPAHELVAAEQSRGRRRPPAAPRASARGRARTPPCRAARRSRGRR